MFNGNSYRGFETPLQRRQAHAVFAQRERARIAALPDGSKTRLLARAIAHAAIARESFSARDAEQAGFSKRDVVRLYDRAFAMVREIEPAIAGLGDA